MSPTPGARGISEKKPHHPPGDGDTVWGSENDNFYNILGKSRQIRFHIL